MALEQEQVAPLLSAQQVAQMLGRHKATVLTAFRRGDLPGIRLGRRTIRFHPSDVAEYVERHRAVVNGNGATP